MQCCIYKSRNVRIANKYQELGRGKDELYARAVTKHKALLLLPGDQLWYFVLTELRNKYNGISNTCFRGQFIMHGKFFF